MSSLCINCGKADVRPDTVRLSGVVRSVPYQVEMRGLKCQNCGYSTLDAKGMTEFSRLLSDKWRAEHGLLTSEQIIALRDKHKESQEQFAKRCNIGSATLKRIEKGKIQDADTNKKILEHTKIPVISLSQYVINGIQCLRTATIFHNLSIPLKSGVVIRLSTTPTCLPDSTQRWFGELPSSTATSVDLMPIIARGLHARY